MGTQLGLSTIPIDLANTYRLNTMDNHIRSLTSLRGIAALIIVVHHFAYYALPQLGVLLSAYSHFFQNGYLSVDLFFILSGFIMTHVYWDRFHEGVSKVSYWQYLRARFARIYPLHLFTLLVLLGLQSIESFRSNPTAFTGKFNILALGANVFMLQAFALNCPPLFWCDTYWNEPAWSISVEFVIYALFPFILFAILKNQPKTDTILYIITLIASLLLIRFTRNNLDNIIGIPSIARCGLECVLGVITYKIYRRQQAQRFLNTNLLAIISTIWIMVIMHNWSEELRGVHDWVILPAFSLLILSISHQSNSLGIRMLNSPLLLYLGTISYSVYMVHWVLITSVKAFWLDKLHLAFDEGLTKTQSILALGLFIPIVILTASLTYRFIEVPLRQYLKPKAQVPV
jgi:peptidoglycan/LPS O-acetylase OafA/YrhL